MMSRVLSCATLGIDAYIVRIETDLENSPSTAKRCSIMVETCRPGWGGRARTARP